ncbi:endochitinase A-like isoform X1 [Girardinichthys multiradiatus]|uniref:endochitinase A-like isoform X1 n=1 Tax=Girardinichthys multiradiatus TaxID=208333 RepID=UPI001FAD19B9|nr:endochitinase A-like isoform X1 [Girardinichthys multiradiatus]
MPSKRKKNKRRMRRVQSQRRALEEQHAGNPPIKSSSGIAISAPPIPTPIKAGKTAPPTCAKLPQAIPISVPLVELPKVEQEPVLKDDATEVFKVEVAAEESDGVLLERAPAGLEVESRVGDEVEGPALVTKGAPVQSSPPVEPSTVEADLAQEVEVIVSEAEPTSEVAAPDEAPVDFAAVAETRDVWEADLEKVVTLAEEHTETKDQLEVAITRDITISESVREADEEPEVEYPSEVEPAAEKTENDTGSEVESVTETLEAEVEAEKVSPAVPAEGGEEKLKVLAEEDSAALSVESVTSVEDVFGPSVENPAVLDTITEAPLDEADPPVVETTEGIADPLVHEFVVTESVSAAKDVVSASAVVQQETKGTWDMLATQTEPMDAAPADPETAVAPAGEKAAADQTCLDVLSDEVKSGGCEVPCQLQFPVEAGQLDAVELSVEISQNGSIVPEVSIEG